jgi:N-acetylmuramic acid 6-phosphate etherase
MSSLFDQLAALQTEGVNPRTVEIDRASAREIVGLLHAEDQTVADAVGAVLDDVAAAVEVVHAAFVAGGRLIYAGAGTSGRLGLVDASEMPPTYGTQPDMVQGLIAGGRVAMFQAVEGAEDSPALAKTDLQALELSPRDVVCGLTASGRTPYVVGALAYAQSLGCTTILVSTNPKPLVKELCPHADVYICPEVGQEPIAGSTRMKSGTAQKMVINMISTASMVRLGKTYGNVMVDLQLTNAKLVERARKIVMMLGRVSYDEAARLLTECDGHVKTALVMAACNCSREIAANRLAASNGFVRPAMEHNA